MFQIFLRGYILKHSQTSIISDTLRLDWETFIETDWLKNSSQSFNASEVNRILGSVNWDAWLYTPGLPPIQPDFTTNSTREADAAALYYVANNGTASPEGTFV